MIDTHGHDGWQLIDVSVRADGRPSETWRCGQCGAVQMIRKIDDQDEGSGQGSTTNLSSAGAARKDTSKEQG